MALEKLFGKKVKARKTHVCLHCRKIIQKGEVYHYNKYFCNRTRQGECYKLHLQCVDIYYHNATELERQSAHWEQWYEEVFV